MHSRVILHAHVGVRHVRAAALFYTAIPADGTLESSVHTVDFAAPVIDFTVGPTGDVWVLLDAERSGAPSSSDVDKPRFVRLLSWKGATVCSYCRVHNSFLLTMRTFAVIRGDVE